MDGWKVKTPGTDRGWLFLTKNSKEMFGGI